MTPPLRWIWRSHAYHPERYGEPCCVLPSRLTTGRMEQVRFADGFVTAALPKGLAVSPEAFERRSGGKRGRRKV